MPKMFGVRYAEVLGTSYTLDLLLGQELVSAVKFVSNYGTEKYVIAAKGVNKTTLRKIAGSLAKKR